MEKRLGLFVLVLGLVVSCSLESIRVTGNPVYTIPAGTMEENLDSYFGPEAIQEALDAGPGELVQDPTQDVYTLQLGRQILTMGTSDFFSKTINLESANKSVSAPSIVVPNLDQSGPLPFSVPFGYPVSFTFTTPAVTLPLPGNLTGANIATGELVLTLNLAALGADSGTATLTLTQGGFPVHNSAPTPFSGNQAVFDLAGTTFNQGDLAAEFTITVNGSPLNEGSLTTGSWSLNIDQFTSLTLAQPGLDLGSNFVVPLDQDVQDLVTGIVLDSSSVLQIVIDNGLPNNVTMTLNSDPLVGPGDPSFIFDAGQTETWNVALLDDPNVIDIDALPMNEFPFELSFALAGYDGTHLTLTGVTPGTSYDFTGSVTVNLVPKIIHLDAAPTTIIHEFPESGSGLDLSGLSDFIPPGVNFQTLTGALTMGNMGPGVSFGVDVRMWATFTDPTDSQFKAVDLLDPSNPSIAPFNPETTATPQSFDYNGSPPAPLSFNMGAPFAVRPSDLKIGYQATITGSSIDVSSQQQDLDIQFNLPLRFEFQNPLGDVLLPLGAAEENPLDLASKNKDLFDRDDQDNPVNKFLDQTGRVILGIDVQNTPIEGVKARMTEGVEGPFLEFTLQPGYQEIVLTPAQVERLKKVPFAPLTEIFMSQTDGGAATFPDRPDSIRMKTDQILRAKLTLTLETDIDYTIDLGGEK